MHWDGSIVVKRTWNILQDNLWYIQIGRAKVKFLTHLKIDDTHHTKITDTMNYKQRWLLRSSSRNVKEVESPWISSRCANKIKPKNLDYPKTDLEQLVDHVRAS